MKLIVGLGNPGIEYSHTRHNLGFMFLDSYAKYKNVMIDQKKLNGLYQKINVNNEPVILLKPQTYMNLSGEVVKSFASYYKIEVENILIIHDDLDIEVGKIKLKSKGSSGGHNGLKNIENNLQTSEYKRLKIGISNDKNVDTKDYVLGKIDKEAEIKYLEMIPLINDIIEDFIVLDYDQLMTKYNKK